SRWEIAINYDKSFHAGFLLNLVNAKEKLGFYIDENHAIRYSGESFKELYVLGLSDEEKFFLNKKTVNQLLVESLGEKWESKVHRYLFYFTDSERELIY